MEIEEGDIVLCTVDRIVGTVVFVKLDSGEEGSMILSEIAPGRIRNLRDYVVPKKKIVCKILKKEGSKLYLSLRRVTQKEQKEVIAQANQEKSYEQILKSILKEKAQETINLIKKEENLVEFLNNSKENPNILEKYIPKKESQRIIEILQKQKKKRFSLKKEFTLKSNLPDGLLKIKKLLENKPEVEIKYISAGKYSIKSEQDTIKNADKKIQEIFNELEKQTKKEGMVFEIKEK